MAEDFYPRPPRGGRQPFPVYVPTLLEISIHALREEGDQGVPYRRWLKEPFLSTPSARRATIGSLSYFLITKQISIHALREEGDELTFIKPCFWDISIHALREEGD